MSIRLRLTLVYTAILALTLTGAGGLLYGTQVQSMYGGEERALRAVADQITDALSRGEPLPRVGVP